MSQLLTSIDGLMITAGIIGFVVFLVMIGLVLKLGSPGK
jgi:hypothetical protein